MTMTPQDMFECEYIQRHLSGNVYREAKQSLEDNRLGDSYFDKHLAEAFRQWVKGIEW
jgi:hypothetical protein